MKSFVITIKDNSLSEQAAERCMKSSKIFIEKFDAVTPDNVDASMKEHDIKWTYPWDQPKMDIKSGLRLSPYPTRDPKTRIACFMSHYLLWKECAEGSDPFLILEHDAIFTRVPDVHSILKSQFQIIGINDPIGATRKSQVFAQKVAANPNLVQPAPMFDDVTIPQGLAGNSAYIIKSKGARLMLDLVKEHGAWPNDALMCRQLLGKLLGVSKIHYTKIQGIQSTTS